jgi:hypothetical protein
MVASFLCPKTILDWTDWSPPGSQRSVSGAGFAQRRKMMVFRLSGLYAGRVCLGDAWLAEVIPAFMQLAIRGSSVESVARQAVLVVLVFLDLS